MKTLHKLDQVNGLLASLPPLPAVVSYYDDFSDCYLQVADPDRTDEWKISLDGRSATLDFGGFGVETRSIVKCWCAFVLGALSPVTAQKYLEGLRLAPIDCVTAFLTCKPENIRSLWKQLHSEDRSYQVFVSLKSLLAFLCRFRIGHCMPEWLNLWSQLPLPKVDKYASVRTGDAIIDVEQEAAIVRNIDDISRQANTSPCSVGDYLLESTCILVCSYQFAMRAKQIAMLEMNGVRIWVDDLEKHPAVHLTFIMIKQRSGKRVFPMVRRVKRDWAPLFVELLRRAKAEGRGGRDHIFRRTPPEIGEVIAEMTESMTKQRRYVTELRHTAAQRLADAGATEEELAEFLGHSDLGTPLIYFGASASQAERVNRALGLSKTYQRVAKIAHDRFISPQELADLKRVQQIAGVPYGIPISGIGGCSVGQPSCPYNPVMSCYGCHKFMPVAELAVHKQVLADLREVVKFFYSASRGESGSPAFQLQQTISKVQAVIDEVGAQNNELIP